MTSPSYVYEGDDCPSLWQYVKEAELSTCWQLLLVKEAKTRASQRQGESVMTFGAIRMTFDFHLTGPTMTECFHKINKAFLQCNKHSHSVLSLLMNWLPLFPFSSTFACTPQKEVPRKQHVTVKYSKYEVWQRKAAQRLRRGVPAILRAKKFRRQAEKIKAQEQAIFHRPLISLPSKLPPILLTTDNYVNHKWARCQPFAQTRVWREKKRLGDYSFVSDVISVAVLFDLPCPVRAHQSLPLLSSTTSWPPGPFLMPPPTPQPNPPILLRHTNMPSHSSCLNSFAPSLFQSPTQKAQTQMMNKKLTIRLNAIQVDP